MADFGIYWKNFARERRQGDWPCSGWFTNSDFLSRATAGDRLWLITSGERCDMAECKRGYLVEILVVASVRNNVGNDADYPSADFAFEVRGAPEGCLAIDPPLLVDSVIRKAGTNSELAIGTVHQGPWRFTPEVSAFLLDRLKTERPHLYDRLAGDHPDGH